ncbi:BspA family leucine-rich repeat surface protein, partial [Vibrio parahaemolyticus]|uniref:BspA family leucine-rich repeat surface protein n=1 Tax=Vibrio parahaemolyticus TaxID=670 RepID=UPI001C5FEF29
MKKTIITLALLTTFASNAAFVSFISDSKYNIASNDPSSETGQIVGGGEYVSSEPSTGGGSEPVVVACEGPELTRDELRNLIDSGNDYSKACVGTITDFSGLFMSRDVTYDITNWDVSSGIKFNFMFSRSESFNQDISGWDVSNGTNFSSMFLYAKSFNQDISGWNVSNGTNFVGMFSETSAFNQNIGGWDVSNGTNFSSMFNG